MWKYVTKDISNEFLLSLHLLDNLDDKEYIKKVYSISNNIVNNYNIFKIKKNSGGYRKIYAPNVTLKHIQRQILNNILNNKAISKYATAYKKGCSLVDNAFPHKSKKIILKLDIKIFFENIQFNDVYNFCFSIEYFSVNIGILLTNLVTYYGFLPQGAPTSAYISNLVMKDFDEEVGKWCKENRISYTRYSDDMTFSGNFNPKEVINKVKILLKEKNLVLNYKKVKLIKNNNRMNVAGIVVNEKIQVSSIYRKKIRQEIYYIKKYGISSYLKMLNCHDESYIKKLYGKVLFVLQINSKDKEFLEFKKYLSNIVK